MTLIVLVGLPGSGKSTYAEELKKRGCMVVSTDAIREQLFGDASIQKDGKKVFQIAYDMINELLVRGHEVVFDATNLTIKDRKQIFKKVCTDDIIAVFQNTPIEVCKERNRNRSRIVPEEVIDKMAEKLTPPTTKEGFQFVITLK